MEEESNPVFKNQAYGQHRELLYSQYADGKFEMNIGYHGESDRIPLQQGWDMVNERIEVARLKVKAGEASPISYYMEKLMVTPLDLSLHSGIMVWRVKRHLKPKVFNRLSGKTLKKYAEAFNITIDQLKYIE
ncbi:MAG: hypothetical protein D4R97_02545 [Bacteroidetes bacterium]|nr:MAG: hypothetical protein D4R97_02545 [Bacteroidota bacterium]